MNVSKILKYLNGELSEEEKTLFEQALNNDKVLYRKFQLVKELEENPIDDDTLSFAFKLKKIQRQLKLLYEQDSVHDTSQSEILQLVKEVDNNVFLEELSSDANECQVETNEKPEAISILVKLSTRSSFKNILAVAAVVCFVFVTSVFYFHSSSNDRLFNQNYEKFSPNSFKRKSIKTLDIKEFYTMGKYDEAIQLSLELFNSNPNDVIARFYSGLSYMETKQLNKAIENLQFVVASQDEHYIEHAQWFLSLCYIKVNETKKALTILYKISPGSIYYKKAVNLLKKLE